MAQFCFVWKPIPCAAAIVQCRIAKNPSHVQLAIRNLQKMGCVMRPVVLVWSGHTKEYFQKPSLGFFAPC
jgi:hypothetical protein